jgi:hypothetical protein
MYLYTEQDAFPEDNHFQDVLRKNIPQHEKMLPGMQGHFYVIELIIIFEIS